MKFRRKSAIVKLIWATGLILIVFGIYSLFVAHQALAGIGVFLVGWILFWVFWPEKKGKKG